MPPIWERPRQTIRPGVFRSFQKTRDLTRWSNTWDTRGRLIQCFLLCVMEGRVIFMARMKKTFPLRIPDKPDSRVIAAIQVTLNKYVKRERGKALPTGADRWNFQCRVGSDCETALPCQLSEIAAGMAVVALAEHPGVYVEILAEPGERQPPKTEPALGAGKGGAE